MIQRLASAMLLCAFLLTGACAREDAWLNKAHTALDTRERALNQRDVALYLSAISQRYGGDATGYTRIKARAESLFGSIEQIRYTSSERSIYKEDDGRIRAVQRFTMELTRSGQTKSLSGQEQLFLVDEAGTIRIVDGL